MERVLALADEARNVAAGWLEPESENFLALSPSNRGARDALAEFQQRLEQLADAARTAAGTENSPPRTPVALAPRRLSFNACAPPLADTPPSAEEEERPAREKRHRPEVSAAE
jgi:hypothetical protein